MLGGAGSPGGDDWLTVTVVRDEHGYGMKVSGDNPVYVQSVKEHGAAWRAGLRSGDRILRVDNVPVEHHSHQQVVHMIRVNPTTVLTVQQHTSRLKTPITAPVPANLEKQMQFEASKVKTIRLMLEQEQKYIRELRNELLKVPDVRKQAEMESAEQRCSTLQLQIDGIMTRQLAEMARQRSITPRTTRTKTTLDKPTPSPLANTGFLSGLPRSLSNLTGQSLRNLRQARQKNQQENQPPLVRQNSDESNNKRRHVHNNTVPMVPTTCLDNVSPPPLPPRSIERPKRNPLSPTSPVNPLPARPVSPHSPINVNPLAKPSNSQSKYYNKRLPDKPCSMHQSMPAYKEEKQFRRSSHSLDGELDGPQPNSIALQMSYPLVNVPPPSLLNDNRTGVPVLHVRSRSSPEQLEHDLCKSTPLMMPLPQQVAAAPSTPAGSAATLPGGDCPARDTPPPGTPPPPYHTNTQPCADPQRAIISMEEDDSPASDNSTYSGLFSTLRSVRESKARTAVLLNWLLGERRCACACLLLVLTDAYRSAGAVAAGTLRRWAYEIHSAFLMPHAVLQLNGVDENMANEIEHVLVNEYDKEELLRNVFRKARQKAKEELAQQLSEFQVKRQVGLGTLYGPGDDVIHKCHVDKIQEQLVVERVMSELLRNISQGGAARCGGAADAHATLLAALVGAAAALHCRGFTMVNIIENMSEGDSLEVRKRWWQSPKSKKKKAEQKMKAKQKPAVVAAAAGGARASFLQRDKLYKQRVKQITKQHPQPFVVRGHHLQLQALCSVAHCHHCDLAVGGLAPQAYVCSDCKLRVHRSCARAVEEGCCLDGEHHNTRISRFMERIHNNQLAAQDSTDKKSRKASGTAHFLNMERSFRKAEDDAWDHTLKPDSTIERRDESDESLYESADGHSDAISASDDALPRLSKTPTISKESLKLAVTDEEAENKFKKTHRKAMSLSNPIEMVKNLGDEWFELAKKELEKNSEKKKSRESLWSEEDRDSIHGSMTLLDQIRRSSRKEDKSQSNTRKISNTDAPKTRKSSKGSSVSSFNFLRRKKTPTSSKPVEVVPEDVTKVLSTDEILNFTKLFLEGEQRYSSIEEQPAKPPVETDTEDETPTPKQLSEHRRRLSRQTSRSKSKVRGKSQSLKVNTLRKSHSGTLKKGKKKSVKTPSLGRSRQTSIVEQTPILKKKSAEVSKQNSWLFSGSRGESKREGSNDEPSAPDADVDTSDANTKEPDKENSWRVPSSGRGVNRAESCRDREREHPRRGKHRNASDPNRLTAHNNHDLEPGAPTAPSGSSSSSSLSSRSNESNTVAAEQQASQSDWSEEDEPLATQWSDSISPHVLEGLTLSARLRKRQEVIHELIVSEGSHLRWLKVLGGVFLRGLESQPTLLPPEDLRALFPNLPSVRERHARLYGELRALRTDADAPLVDIKGVADAMMNTLGDSGYAPCLAKFCRGQRMALEALRERRRKNKDLHSFLASREQLPLCGRLQLRDLLACVWQRLTKYQLLLEGVVKTVNESDCESEEDVSKLNRALTVAKEVLHSVDMAIRTAENEHRLRTIQSKLEIRVPSGPEWEELRRLDLTHHALKMEGELSIKNDNNKKIHVLALMLEECLVLIQREGDKFVLKPISQTSQQQHLSPLVKWDKVLFRPNAAVRNTFFLMNINGVQMHELSANTGPEYATWVKNIQESPLAKLTELKPTVTPSHQPSRSTDDSGINVSRNPSDASEKSNSTVEDESERDRTSAERSSTERERESNVEEKVERHSVDKEEKEEVEKEEKHKVRRPTEGRIVTHSVAVAPALEPRAALCVLPPAATATATAERAYTHQERLRRLDGVIARALRAKAAVVGELLHVPPQHARQVADLAVADALGQVDVSQELRQLSRSGSVEDDAPDMHQLLLAACTQANQLTSMVRQCLAVDEAAALAARARCDVCARGRTLHHADTFPSEPEDPLAGAAPLAGLLGLDAGGGDARDCDEIDVDDVLETNASAALLARRLVSASLGMQHTLSRLLLAAPPPRDELREELVALRERHDALRARGPEHQSTEETSFAKGVDPTIQDQPSNGG